MQKLEQNNIQDILALTPMQEGMLFHFLKGERDDNYFAQLRIGLSGPLDLEHIESAWNLVTAANDMLRSVYRWRRVNNPMQIVLKQHSIQFAFHDASSQNEHGKEKLINEIMVNDRLKGFDLSSVPFRVALFRYDELRHDMLISYHHIILDGWSAANLINEFFNAYNDFSNNRNPKLLPKTPFKEFIKVIQHQDESKQKAFWREYLRGVERLEFGALKKQDKNRNESAEYRLRVPDNLQNSLEDFVRSQRVTFAALIYCAWGVLLQRYTNSPDVLFGITTAGRSAPIKGIAEMVGLFINTLPLRIGATSAKIKHLISDVTRDIQLLTEFEHTALVKIKEYCGFKHQEELFDSIVIIENYPLRMGLAQRYGHLAVESISAHEKTNYSLTVGVTRFDGETEVTFGYACDSFETRFIQNLSQHFLNILMYFSRYPDGEVCTVELLSQEEKNLLHDLNGNPSDYVKHTSIPELFEAQVNRTPDWVAVTIDNQHLTFGELSKRANQLARLLRRKNATADSVVGILASPSLEMIVAIMAILKAGSAYLPIDTGLPEERIQYMAADCNLNIVLTNLAIEDMPQLPGIEYLDLNDRHIYSGNFSTPKKIAAPNNLSYIIYTSGSTGLPKAVLVEHRNVVAFLNAFDQQVEISCEDIVLQNLSYAFDAFIEEVFPVLLRGGRIVILKKHAIMNMTALADFINRHQITIINSAPHVLNELDKLNSTNGVKTIISGGSLLNRQHVGNFLDLAKVYNAYGPTETTVCATLHRCLDGAVIHFPIGKPLPNYRVYILDYLNHLQPLGIGGELSIAGDGVARGYLNRPELTAEKFLENPLQSGERIYKTGDLARWLPDGNLDYLGRKDRQVKIRGFRIEPEEIESRLLQHVAITDAVVRMRQEDNGECYLCAYFVGATALSPSDLRMFLMQKLSPYMIPSFFIRLPELPLTRNGKIDYEALPPPRVDEVKNYVAPRNNYETKIARLWQDVLRYGRIGVHDNFFDIGGNSTHLIRLISRLNEQFVKPVSIMTMFQYPTISTLASYLEGDKELTPNLPLGLMDRSSEISKAKSRLKQILVRAA